MADGVTGTSGDATQPDRTSLPIRRPTFGGVKVEPAVTRSLKRVVGEAEGRHVKALKDALADAQKKMAAQDV